MSTDSIRMNERRTCKVSWNTKLTNFGRISYSLRKVFTNSALDSPLTIARCRWLLLFRLLHYAYWMGMGLRVWIETIIYYLIEVELSSLLSGVLLSRPFRSTWWRYCVRVIMNRCHGSWLRNTEKDIPIPYTVQRHREGIKRHLSCERGRPCYYVCR